MICKIDQGRVYKFGTGTDFKGKEAEWGRRSRKNFVDSAAMVTNSDAEMGKIGQFRLQFQLLKVFHLEKIHDLGRFSGLITLLPVKMAKLVKTYREYRPPKSGSENNFG